MNKNTVVISAFPGTGKSYCFNHYEDVLDILDSDSSKFSWILNEDGTPSDTRDSNFPCNYMEHIRHNIGLVDIIFVSSHSEVIKALYENGITPILIFPSLDMKEEMIQRYKDRGNTEDFIGMLHAHYEDFIIDMRDNIYNFPTIELNETTSYITLEIITALLD